MKILQFYCRHLILFLFSLFWFNSAIAAEKLTVWVNGIGPKAYGREVVDNSRYDSDSTTGIVKIDFDRTQPITLSSGCKGYAIFKENIQDEKLELIEAKVNPDPSFPIECDVWFRVETSDFSPSTNAIRANLDFVNSQPLSVDLPRVGNLYATMYTYDECGFEKERQLEVRISSQNKALNWNENGSLHCLGMKLRLGAYDYDPKTGNVDMLKVKSGVTTTGGSGNNPTQLAVWINDGFKIVDNGPHDYDQTTGTLTVLFNEGSIPLTDCYGEMTFKGELSSGKVILSLLEGQLYPKDFGIGPHCWLKARAEVKGFVPLGNTDVTVKLDTKLLISGGTIGNETADVSVDDRCGFEDEFQGQINLFNQNIDYEFHQNGPIYCLGMNLYFNLPDAEESQGIRIKDSISLTGEVIASGQKVLFASDTSISPSLPTPKDNIQIKFADKWKNSCVPQYDSHTVTDNNLTVFLKSEGGLCADVITDFNVTKDIGLLSQGQYNVYIFVGDKLIGFNSFLVTKEDLDIKTVYCVHDNGLNDSQFCYGTPLPTPPIQKLGPLYKDCDIEALDILDLENGNNDLYAAAGDDTPRKGHLYYVYKHNGDIIDLGDVNGPGALDEIDAISFHPHTKDLWLWAQGEGLYKIDTSSLIPPFIPFPYSPFPALPPFPTGIQIQPVVNIDNPVCLPPTSLVPIIPATFILNEPVEVEDITWNWRGDVLYAVENVHDGHDVDSHGDHEDLWTQPDFDFDFEQVDIDDDGDIEGVRLWASDGNIITEVCPDLSPKIAEKLGKKAEIEAIESLPPDLIPDRVNPETEDLLLVGFHGPNKMLYAVIITPSITSPSLKSDPECELWRWLEEEIITPFNDIEGLAYSPMPKPIEPPDNYPFF